jgi:hypothetical protein
MSERIAWLTSRPDLWDADLYTLATALKSAGLIAPSTYWLDVSASLQEVVHAVAVATEGRPTKERRGPP